MGKKKEKLWAVIDENGDLLHQGFGGQVSVFVKKETAEFLAYGWLEPTEKWRVVEVSLKIIK